MWGTVSFYSLSGFAQTFIAENEWASHFFVLLSSKRHIANVLLGGLLAYATCAVILLWSNPHMIMNLSNSFSLCLSFLIGFLKSK